MTLSFVAKALATMSNYKTNYFGPYQPLTYRWKPGVISVDLLMFIQSPFNQVLTLVEGGVGYLSTVSKRGKDRIALIASTLLYISGY